MKPKAYLIFHLNLAFSSIDKSDWPTVIERCYWPLLDMISKYEIPLGIEITGWTLNRIFETDPEWVNTFKELLEDGKCELVGSGYCQIISPICPYEVNIKNHVLGFQAYSNLLGVRPSLAFINEMTFSDSMVDVLSDVEYSGFVMDRDNTKLALEYDKVSLNEMPKYAKGIEKAELPVLWGDSILFQKLQHVSHGDISKDDYINFISKRIADGNNLLSLYCNDAETFDFRPGRFTEERAKNVNGEWKIINDVLNLLKDKMNFEIILPSIALEIQNSGTLEDSRSITSAGYPITVKKQPKYNISRWSVTGQDDTWLNTMCYRIFNELSSKVKTDDNDWKNLCELWASDLRTHLTQQRWIETQKKVEKTLEKYKLTNHYGNEMFRGSEFFSEIANIKLSGFSPRIFGDGIYLELQNNKMKIVFNLRRGLAIESLFFYTHENECCLGTLKHGHLESIVRGADYYSGGIVIELPESRTKITDLSPVSPSFLILENGDLIIKAVVPSPLGDIIKYFRLCESEEKISISYDLSNLRRKISTAKIGNFTLSSSFSKALKDYSCNLGGNSLQNFEVNGSFEHSGPATRFVSSSRGFSSTNGAIKLGFTNKDLYFVWDQSECFALCLLDHDNEYTRLAFSVCEFDETSRESESYGNLSVTISSKQ